MQYSVSNEIQSLECGFCITFWYFCLLDGWPSHAFPKWMCALLHTFERTFQLFLRDFRLYDAINMFANLTMGHFRMVVNTVIIKPDRKTSYLNEEGGKINLNVFPTERVQYIHVYWMECMAKNQTYQQIKWGHTASQQYKFRWRWPTSLSRHCTGLLPCVHCTVACYQ